MVDDLPPFVSSFLDRHGKRRYRYRRRGKTISLPGQPGEDGFELAYTAAIAGKPVVRGSADVTRLKTAAAPRSLRAAWRILITETDDWKRLAPETRANQTAIAERFLTGKISDDEDLTFGDLPLPDLRRRHVKAILARMSGTPHAAGHVLRLIRKLTGVGLDQEWIESDPTYRLKYRPEYKGWKAWPDDIRAQFEARWPIGTTPRLVYALALYFGHRRSDVSTARWSDLEADGSNTVQRKTGKSLWIPIHPELALVLEATPRRGDTIVVTEYGKPFSSKPLTGRMADWTRSASMPPGYTLHGLRKTLGKMLAEQGATTRQLMAVLGHDDIAHAELYSREAEQRRLAKAAIDKLVGLRLTTTKRGQG
jgi:integrase